MHPSADRSAAYRSWLLGELAILLLLAATTAVLVAVPDLRDVYDAPRARLVLDTVVAIAALVVATLAAVRFTVEGRRLDLLVCAGFAVGGLGVLALAVAPAVAEGEAARAEAWAGLLVRLLAAALIAAAAFARGRVARTTRTLVLTVASVAALLLAAWGACRLLAGSLPSSSSGEIGSTPASLAAGLALLALLALTAAVGFGVRFRRHGQDLDGWLALALTLVLFAELHSLLSPTLSTAVVLQGDVFRVLAYGVLLVGVLRAIRAAEFGRAVAEERARVAREIHDGLAQYLFALSTQASMLESGAPVEEVLPRLQQAAAAAQQEARFAVLALSSASGTAPFDAALRRYVELLTADGAIEVDVDIEHDVQLAPDEQIEVFRIVQEGLANARRHAGDCRVEVVIAERSGRRVVRVTDDGQGFDGEGEPAGQGLRNMRRRAESIEGDFTLSSLPGLGTEVEVLLRA